MSRSIVYTNSWSSEFTGGAVMSRSTVYTHRTSSDES